MANKKSLFIIATVTIASISMICVDRFLCPSYFVKAAIKMALFIGFPVVYCAVFKDASSQIRKLFVPKKECFVKSLILGILICALIVGGYFCLKDVIDFSGVAKNLDKDNFIPIIIYVALINSLLEEFFFRGFAFMILKSESNRKFAYVFSGLLFALYHIGIMTGWFGIGLFALMMLGLFVGGCIFNYLNEKNSDIYSSWLVHMFANIGINTVGCILLEII